jgi:hypothetical protein
VSSLGEMNFKLENGREGDFTERGAYVCTVLINGFGSARLLTNGNENGGILQWKPGGDRKLWGHEANFYELWGPCLSEVRSPWFSGIRCQNGK